MVIAKTEKAKTHLGLQFFNKTSDRKYVAVCWGNLEDETGTITGHIGRNLTNRKVMACFPDGSHGKHAVTHYRVLERLGYVNVVECILETAEPIRSVLISNISNTRFSTIKNTGEMKF